MKTATFFSLFLLAVSLSGQTEFEKLSPFTAVEWQGDSAVVLFENVWYGLASLDGIPAADFRVHCQKMYGKRWKKRFAEDLVEVMHGMGHPSKKQVPLTLFEGSGQVQKTGEMTEANRRAVRDFNQNNPAAIAVGDLPPGVARLPKSANSGAKARNADDMLAAGYKSYKVESGIVEYQLEGATQGTETLYFDKWGWRQARYESGTMKVMGMTQKRQGVQFLDGEWMTNYNPETNYATRTTNPLFRSFFDNMDAKSTTEVAEKMLEQMGGKVTGTETIAGKDCEKWEIPSLGSTSWVWNGLVLKETSNIFGISVTKTAISVKTGVAVPEEKLTVPKDAKGISSPMPSKH